MHVYIIEGEKLETFSTARKAIETAVKQGMGEYKIFVSHNAETGKTTTFPLSSVKRAIAQLRTAGFIKGTGETGAEAFGIVQRRVN